MKASIIFKTILFGVLLVGFCFTASAQKYYAVMSGEEKETQGSGYAVDRLMLSYIFEITFCSNASPELNKSITAVRNSGVLGNQIKEVFDKNYEAYHNRRGYTVNTNYGVKIFYFTTYDEANRKRKEILGEYSNSRNRPKDGIKDISLRIPCIKGL